MAWSPPDGTPVIGRGRMPAASTGPAVYRLRLLPGRLTVDNAGKGAWLALFDASGALIASRRSGASGAAGVETAGFARGMYVVRLTNSVGVAVWKTVLR